MADPTDRIALLLLFQPTLLLLAALVVATFGVDYGEDVDVSKWLWGAIAAACGMLMCGALYAAPRFLKRLHECREAAPLLFLAAAFAVVGSAQGLVIAMSETGESYQPLHFALQTASTVGYGSNTVNEFGQAAMALVFLLVVLSPQLMMCGSKAPWSAWAPILGFKLLSVAMLVASHQTKLTTGEGNVVEALYYAGTTMTTVGYGDIAPKSHLGVAMAVPAFAGLMYAPLWDAYGYLEWAREAKTAATASSKCPADFWRGRLKIPS